MYSKTAPVAVEVKNLGKTYQIYRRPIDRLLQSLCLGHRCFYRELKALDNISFNVRRGQCVGIIGMNGAGKSTLLQLFAGTLTASSGGVAIYGRLAALLELGTGFDPEFTGRENIFMNASLYGLTREETEKKYDAIVAFADIGDAIDQPVKTYSSGMAMRLAFAVIANIDADILLIDEALAVGDAVFVQKCMRFLRKFIASHTVILVTHDTGAVLSLCDTAIWLDGGKIRQCGAPKAIVDNYLAFCYRKRQGNDAAAATDAVSTQKPMQFTRVPREGTAVSAAPERDVRQELFDSSNLRHSYRFFEFDENAPSFGKGGVAIDAIDFTDSSGRPVNGVLGGEEVELHIRCVCRQEICGPIIGFAFRNYLGENIFGDNTFLASSDANHVLCAAKGEHIEAVFAFQMPRLPAGDYSLHAAVAEGTQQEHVQHQWFHDALRIRSNYEGNQGVLVGIPMHRVELNKLTESSEKP